MGLIKLLVKAKFASRVTVNEGFKLSLFRYPEDAGMLEEKKPAQSKTKGVTGKK